MRIPNRGLPGGSVYVDAYKCLCVDAIASSMGAMDGRGTRLSRVVIVLTLQTRKEEGHLAYRSQSDNPLQGSTLGGSTDDPGRQHTRTAAARHEAGVSAACREVGISRTVFYRWRKRLERYGPDGLHPRRRHAQRGRPVQLAPEVERLILSVALSAGT